MRQFPPRFSFADFFISCFARTAFFSACSARTGFFGACSARMAAPAVLCAVLLIGSFGAPAAFAQSKVIRPASAAQETVKPAAQKTNQATAPSSNQNTKQTTAQTTTSQSDKNAARVSVSLKQAVARALEYNAKLAVQEYTLDTVRIAKNAAWFVLVPRVSLSAVYNRRNLEPAAFSGQQRESVSGRLAVSTDLATLVGGMVGILKSQQDYNAKKISLETFARTTAAETQKLYFDVEIARRTLDVLKQRLEVAKVDMREAESAYNDGLRDEYTYLRTRLSLLTAEQAYSQQENAEADARRALLIAMGHENISAALTLTDKIPEVSEREINAVLDLQSENNANERQQKAQLSALKYQRLAYIFDFLPTFSLGWSMDTRSTGEISSATIAHPDYYGDDTGSLSATLSFDINKYLPWSSTWVSLRTTNKNIEIAEVQSALAEANDRSALESLRQKLVLLREAFEVNKEQVRLAQRAYGLGQEAYKSGLLTVREYIAAEAELRDAQINQITQQAQIVRVMLDMQLLADSGSSDTTSSAAGQGSR